MPGLRLPHDARSPPPSRLTSDGRLTGSSARPGPRRRTSAECSSALLAALDVRLRDASAPSCADGTRLWSMDMTDEGRSGRRRVGRSTAASRAVKAGTAVLLATAAPATVLAGPLPTPQPMQPTSSSHDPYDRVSPAPAPTRRLGAAHTRNGGEDGQTGQGANPTRAPRRRERAVPPRYTYSDGVWVEDFGWSLRGRGTTHSNVTAATASMDEEKSGPSQDASGRILSTYATNTGDQPSLSTSSDLPSSATRTISATAASALAAAEMAAQPSDSTASGAATASVSIPAGWQAKTRETDYYAVPIIIAMSVLVAVIVVIGIFISVFVRRKKCRREKRRNASARSGGGKEVGEEKGWRGVVDKAIRPVRSAKTKVGKKRPRGGAGGESATAATAASAGASGAGGNSAAYRRVRTNGVPASRARPRRRRQRDDAEVDEDEATALTRTGTRSSASSVAHDTLTARLSARMRGDRPSTGSSGGAGATTMFSRDATSPSQISLSASALSRISSRASHHSSLGNATPAPITTIAPPEILFTPADDPTLPDHLPIPGSISASNSSSPGSEGSASGSTSQVPSAVSSFGALITTDALPAPGPPAYRPSSSTVLSTRRYGAGEVTAPPEASSSVLAGCERNHTRRIGGLRRAWRSSAPSHGDDDEDEGEWHWPGEKGRPFASEAGPSAGPAPPSPPLPPSGALEPSTPIDEEDEPPIDRALYTAHVATDDKAILARLRAQRDRAPSDLRLDGYAEASTAMPSESGPMISPPAPSAPLVPDDADDPDFDEDGFERFDHGSSVPAMAEDQADASSHAGPAASTSILPAPPQRVQQSSSFALTAAHQASVHSHVPSSQPDASISLHPPGHTTAPLTSKEAIAAEYGAADDDEVDALPQYLAGGSAGRQVLGLASAPVMTDDDDDSESDAELSEAELGVLALRRNEGEREQEGVV